MSIALGAVASLWALRVTRLGPIPTAVAGLLEQRKRDEPRGRIATAELVIRVTLAVASHVQGSPNPIIRVDPSLSPGPNPRVPPSFMTRRSRGGEFEWEKRLLTLGGSTWSILRATDHTLSMVGKVRE